MAYLPLECNPDVMNKFLEKLGISNEWKFVDVCGLEPETLAWVPEPVLSVIFLFPGSQNYLDFAAAQLKEIEENGQEVSTNVYHIKQLVSNTCGTIALLHSVSNNLDSLEIKNEEVKKMLEFYQPLSALEKGEMLQVPDSPFLNIHQELATEGQTEANPGEQVNNHFVAFVHKDGTLYEMNGGKEFPINHGPTTAETLLQDAAKVCKDYVSRDSDDVNFSMMALARADPE